MGRAVGVRLDKAPAAVGVMLLCVRVGWRV